MMKIWLACFIAMFAVAELFQWVKGVVLPLPIYILGGAFLAIASNYGKRPGLSLSQQDTTANPERKSFEREASETPASFAASSSPELKPPAPPPKSELKSYPSISFTIRKPDVPTQAVASEDEGQGC